MNVIKIFRLHPDRVSKTDQIVPWHHWTDHEYILPYGTSLRDMSTASSVSVAGLRINLKRIRLTQPVDVLYRKGRFALPGNAVTLPAGAEFFVNIPHRDHHFVEPTDLEHNQDYRVFRHQVPSPEVIQLDSRGVFESPVTARLWRAFPTFEVRVYESV